MFYQTTEAHEALRAKIREFAETEVKPVAFLLDQENRFPTEAVRKLGELGLMGIPYEKKYGGAELDTLSYAIAVEELARVDGGTGVILSAHTSLGTYPIYAFGTEEQKMKYLPDLCTGRKIGAFGLTEPNAGSDAGGTETTAVDMGDHWLLNGEKIFITNGGEADTYVVFAVTTPDIGTRGISAFIVERGWEGFAFGDHYDKMGIRSSATCQLLFNNVKVPKENLLGKEGEGFKIAMSTLDGGRIGIAAQALLSLIHILLVHIDLAHLERTAFFFGKLMQYGREHFARSAPVRIEIQQEMCIRDSPCPVRQTPFSWR